MTAPDLHCADMQRSSSGIWDCPNGSEELQVHGSNKPFVRITTVRCFDEQLAKTHQIAKPTLGREPWLGMITTSLGKSAISCIFRSGTGHSQAAMRAGLPR